jgi:hypothetical protein
MCHKFKERKYREAVSSDALVQDILLEILHVLSSQAANTDRTRTDSCLPVFRV